MALSAIPYWISLLSNGLKKKAGELPRNLVEKLPRPTRGYQVESRAPSTVKSVLGTMATSLAAQLAQISAKSKSSLNVKTQKAAHSKSLIFEPRVAAAQSFQTIYTLCHDGFEELCRLDGRFSHFSATLFSEQSQEEDRTQMNAAENVQLDQAVGSFLRLCGGKLRLMPAIKAVEWLIRRFRYAVICTVLSVSSADGSQR